MIEKYLDGFPYTGTTIGEDDISLFFLEPKGNSKICKLLDLERSNELSDGIVACEEDFTKRNFWPVEYLPERVELLIQSDEDNKENMNLFLIDINSRNLRQITHGNYLGVYGLSLDHKTLVYGDRYETNQGKYKTKLYIRNFPDGEDREIAHDIDWEYKLGWSSVCFSRDKKKVYFRVDKDNMRRFNNIVELDVETGKWKKLLPEDQECSGVWILSHEVVGDDLYYVSDVDGVDNIFHYNLSRGEYSKLTDYKIENNGIRMMTNNKDVVVSLADRENDCSPVSFLSLKGSQASVFQEFNSNGTLKIFSANEKVFFWRSLFNDPATLLVFEKGDEGFEEVDQIKLYKGKKDQLVHNNYRYVSFPSFDGKTVPAFLSLPKGEVKAAVIVSFYGGENYYRTGSQMLAEKGIAVLSPAVRGSWTHGREWRELIKGDLGGNEILDLVWGAKFLEKELGLPAQKIGVQGGSHGGYSTLRAMTMPANFNDVEGSDYPWGFGLCWAGFADLEDFYHTSNIPDWLVDMLGPYEGNEQKYRDRSPVHFFENLKAPLYISHGTNDARVSPTSMDGFIEKLKASDKTYKLHLIEGAGHGAGNREQDLKEYTDMLSFLDEFVLG